MGFGARWDARQLTCPLMVGCVACGGYNRCVGQETCSATSGYDARTGDSYGGEWNCCSVLPVAVRNNKTGDLFGSMQRGLAKSACGGKGRRRRCPIPRAARRCKRLTAGQLRAHAPARRLLTLRAARTPAAHGLFLGSVGAAYNKDALKALNVTHILIVAKSLEPAYPNDFIYKKIEVLDSPDVNLEQHFDECIEFIDEAKRMGGGVLVHCFAGRSRSVTIVVAYLMKQHNMSLSQALTLIRSKRPHVAPNQGFLEQLTNFGKSLQVKLFSNVYNSFDTSSKYVRKSTSGSKDQDDESQASEGKIN
ncbi:hypothetical protein Taro_052267 [Colocasia esculenta]|uniref:Dual specificity protein phosphatase 1 n=1 Tax=Colocasia esculenta TaxID=4460 RepID=A0A843XJQ3_COLES|nr:hypothetical protein [Colocasia esculenta]